MGNETQPDNPPAFPLPGIMGQPVNEGMTLRDWFAGQALAGLSAQPDARSTTDRDPEKLKAWRKSLAEADAAGCYVMADAMLAERAKEEQP